MKPVKNAKRIALRSYSMWANYLGIAALIAPELIFVIWGVDTNPRLWWVSGLALILFGIAGRLIDQGMTRSPALVMVAALFLAMGKPTIIDWPPDTTNTAANYSQNYSVQDVLAVAVPLIAKWEGLRTTAYQDIVGVWTVCYGETKGVRPGDTYTKAECGEMLAQEVLAYRAGWRSYTTAETRSHRLTAPREAAFTSLAYNAGVYAIGKSTATRRLNAGDIAGACTAIGWWNKAGGRVVRGLVNRRTEEVALCRVGLT